MYDSTTNYFFFLEIFFFKQIYYYNYNCVGVILKKCICSNSLTLFPQKLFDTCIEWFITHKSWWEEFQHKEAFFKAERGFYRAIIAVTRDFIICSLSGPQSDRPILVDLGIEDPHPHPGDTSVLFLFINV